MIEKNLTAKEALNILCNDIESLLGFLNPEDQEEYDVALLKKIILNDLEDLESFREIQKLQNEIFRLNHPELYEEYDDGPLDYAIENGYLDYEQDDEEELEDE